METKTDLAEKFAQLYYAEVDPEELAAREPRDLQGAAAAHLAFGRRFAGGGTKVRAYNPVRDQHGWHSTHSVVEIVNDDMPFLVDSVTMEVNRQGLTLHLVIHPVLRVTRDGAGELLEVTAPAKGGSSRSCTSRSTVRPTRRSSPSSRAASRRCSPMCARR